MHRQRLHSCAVTFLLLAVLSCAIFRSAPNVSPGTQSAPAEPVADIVIDHGGHVDPEGPIYKGANEEVYIRIENTDRRCFIYKGVIVPSPSATGRSAADEVVTLKANTGTPGPPAIIRITAVRNPRGPQDCDYGVYPERKEGSDPGPWEVRILRTGWDIAFSGAYTADSLTNPVYGLVPGQMVTDTTSTATTTGYFIRRFKDQEDSVRLGAGAMIHAIRTGPHSLSRWDTGFAPTFGIGVENNSPRYFFGLGLRFGDKFFMSAGIVAGSINRLPAGLTADKPTERTGFTTNANALSTLGSRARLGYFFGVSFSFAGVGPDAFKGPFRDLKITSAGTTTTGTSTTGTPKTGSTSTTGSTGTTATGATGTTGTTATSTTTPPTTTTGGTTSTH